MIQYTLYIFHIFINRISMLGKQQKMMTNKILPDIPKHKNKKRNRTFCRENSPKTINNRRKQNTTQCITVEILNEIFEQINSRIDQINEHNFYQDLKFNISCFARNICFLNDPQHQSIPSRLILPENEPQRNAIDPMIGLDKHILSNKRHQSILNTETQINNLEKKSSNHIEANSKKFAKNSIEKRKSSAQLIPLPKTSTSLIDAKAEDFYRDKILKQIDHKNMLSMISTQSNTLKPTLGGTVASITRKQQCNYDYNGDRINLIKTSQAKNHTNIIKSLYKFSRDQHTELYGKQSQTFIKFNSGRKEQEIADGKLLNQTVSLSSLQLSIKSRLQTQMRKNKMQFKTVFAD